MIRALTLAKAAANFGGTLFYPDCHFQAVSTDSRSLNKGDLFVALQGEHFDAHQFIGKAAQKACGLVVERADKQLDIPQWVVSDTTIALGQLAQLARRDFTGVLVAVTGSSGKTTVKEMIAAILRGLAPVLATRGNLNNHIGVPLTLLQLQADQRFAVVEMGTSAPGEIAYLTDMAGPDIALVNNVMPAHMAGFGTEAAIAEEKGQIYRGLSARGTAVLNLDQPHVDAWQSHLPCSSRLSYSLEATDADFTASEIGVDDKGCYRFVMDTPAGPVPVQMGLPGKHNIANALGAAACAFAAGANPQQIASGLASVQPVKGRMQYRRGFAGARIIDDSYNANPGSMRAAIDVLASLPSPRFLVLGDMAELGPDEGRLHQEMGAYAADSGVDRLYAVGPLSAHTVSRFGSGGRHFDDKAALVHALEADIDSGTTVLVKGSRSAGMEEIVHLLSEGDN